MVAVIAIGTLVVVIALRRSKRIIAAKSAELTQLQSRAAHAEAEARKIGAENSRFLAEQDQAIRDAVEAAEESTRTVLKSSARTLQGLAAEQQVVIDRISLKYGGHEVLNELLQVNHSNAQLSRRAQAISVICGGILGRRRDPASVYDVVRSAQGQIVGFNRVDILSQGSFSIKAPAVSAVSLAVAELLDNAASSSNPNTSIEVTFRTTPNGLCIVIDDAGVGMSEEDKQKASALLSGQFVPSMAQLGNPPKFGFPVIAKLSRDHGFHVDVTGTSRYGGVRAVVLLPQDLWTEEDMERRTSPQFSAVPSPGADASETVERTVGGLPRRGARQVPVARVRDEVRPVNPVGASQDGSQAAGRRMGAFQRGTLSGRESLPGPDEGSERR
ncbi:ATP-binding protein [Streptomyces sp.]|uniref:ATP-binding protein n=1 Tax=Streptomyces sp. TaxID=1931 RepID=UPI002F40ED95